MPRAQRKCIDCPTLIPAGQRRCPTHQADTERARGTRQQRGYDAAHQHERERWAPIVATGTVTCARCHQRIAPDESWDLGHTDDRTTWTGPEHALCNRRAAGKAAHPA